jgi:biotin synthase-like enzyme
MIQERRSGISRPSPRSRPFPIALFRFIFPEKEIRVCAEGTALRIGILIFAAGADGFMIGNYSQGQDWSRKMISE